MKQYQRQQKPDQALQVALQILRLRPLSTANARPVANVGGSASADATTTINPGDRAEDDYARREAIQVLSRSGKLDELIARAEAQLERSPNSMQVLQTLAEYARVANDKDKVKAIYERMAKARPDDARLRLQLATQLFQAGDAAARSTITGRRSRLDPSLLPQSALPDPQRLPAGEQVSTNSPR